MYSFLIAILCVLFITLGSLYDKKVVDDNHFLVAFLVRTLYILLLILGFLILINPKLLYSKDVFNALKHKNLILVSFFTCVGMLMYYYLLSKYSLYFMTLLFPITMIMTIILANIVLKEKIVFLQWIGIIITFIGIIITVMSKK